MHRPARRRRLFGAALLITFMMSTGARGAETWMRSARSERLSGPALAIGATPIDAAAAAGAAFERQTGVPAASLRARAWSDPTSFAQRVTVDGAHELAIVRFDQVHDGLTILDARMVIVLRRSSDESPWHAVHVNPDVVPMHERMPAAKVGPRRVPQDMMRVIRDRFGHSAMIADDGNAIWAGPSGERIAPAVVRVFGVRTAGGSWRVLVDATTNAMLHVRSNIFHESINGHARGLATEGIASDTCEAEALATLPFVGVQSADGLTFADADGAYSIDAERAAVSLHGEWFRIQDFMGADLTAPVTAEAPDATFNARNDDEVERAQVNAYREANRVRDVMRAINPDFPGLNDASFIINVNRTDGSCPGNAWYNADDVTLNFCRSGSGLPNTAWSSIVHHEFGHHLIQMAGSGQGEYGEGMSDAIAVLVADDPRIGVGIEGTCGVPFRTADNTFAFPCNGTIHTCGQVLSGAIWDLRQLLSSRLGSDAALEVVRRLTLNSILLHTGSAIDASIYLDMLTLDDDDGDLSNGTPHEPEITEAFMRHNLLPAPPPANDACLSAADVGLGTITGDNAHAGSSDAVTTCGGPFAADVWYRYVPSKDGLLEVIATDATFDVKLSMHSDCPPTSENLVGCNEENCSEPMPSTIAPATAGVPIYVRVSGCGNARGQFTLLLRGAPISIALSEVVDDFTEPGESLIVPVDITDGEDPLDPTTAALHFRFGPGAYRTRPLVDAGDGTYHAILPPAPCGVTPEFFLTAADIVGRAVREPSTPDAVFQTEIATVTPIWTDDFETDRGWTMVGVSGATDGFWERGVPINDPEWPHAPSADGDGSGQCYLTDNGPGETDVDDGGVRLTSPTIGVVGSGEIALRYRYFLRKEDIVNADRIRTEISVMGPGGPWTVVRDHSADTALEWRTADIRRNELIALGVSPSFSTVVRFTAFDFDTQTIVEAGIDAFEFVRLSCEAPAICHADCHPAGGDGIVDIVDIATIVEHIGATGGFCDVTPVDAWGTPGNGIVNVDDVIAAINQFGVCGE